MQDRETDSYWSIMTEEALHGAAKGSKLEPLPGSTKTTWGEWKKRHPDTLVLSYRGREHVPHDPYSDYFVSHRGFGGIQAQDTRLPDKAMIYSFHWNGTPYAVPHNSFIDGGPFIWGIANFSYTASVTTRSTRRVRASSPLSTRSLKNRPTAGRSCAKVMRRSSGIRKHKPSEQAQMMWVKHFRVLIRTGISGA